jgi:hypothetical protein
VRQPWRAGDVVLKPVVPQSHNQVPSNGIAGRPGSIVDPERALLIIGGLTNKPPDRNPNVDRIPASFILSYAHSNEEEAAQAGG